jgi:HK97 gp10 family phage protein
MPFIEIIVDATGPIELCQRLALGAMTPVKRAVGRAALSLQAQVRASLQSMIYATPERGYRRTGTLMRSSHAAPPDIDHSGDEQAAFGGADLAATDPMKVVGGDLAQGGFSSEIGSWIHYAHFVHDGTIHMAARPFLGPAAAMARAQLEAELAVATEEIIRAAK